MTLAEYKEYIEHISSAEYLEEMKKMPILEDSATRERIVPIYVDATTEEIMEAIGGMTYEDYKRRNFVTDS